MENIFHSGAHSNLPRTKKGEQSLWNGGLKKVKEICLQGLLPPV